MAAVAKRAPASPSSSSLSPSPPQIDASIFACPCLNVRISVPAEDSPGATSTEPTNTQHGQANKGSREPLSVTRIISSLDVVQGCRITVVSWLALLAHLSLVPPMKTREWLTPFPGPASCHDARDLWISDFIGCKTPCGIALPQLRRACICCQRAKVIRKGHQRHGHRDSGKPFDTAPRSTGRSALDLGQLLERCPYH